MSFQNAYFKSSFHVTILMNAIKIFASKLYFLLFESRRNCQQYIYTFLSLILTESSESAKFNFLYSDWKNIYYSYPWRAFRGFNWCRVRQWGQFLGSQEWPKLHHCSMNCTGCWSASGSNSRCWLLPLSLAWHECRLPEEPSHSTETGPPHHHQQRRHAMGFIS